MPAKISIENVRLFGVASDISKLIQGHDVEVIKVYFGRETPIEEMCKKLGNPDIIIAGSMITYNGELFRRLPRLKAVIRWGVGYDNIILEDATREGVIVSRLPPYLLNDAVAEQTVALMLSLLRKIPQAHEFVKRGEWRIDSNFNKFEELIGESLEDKVIGFIGLGAIGFRVLELIKPFRPRLILVYDPYVSRDFIRLSGAIAVSSVDELLTYSDIITVHAPLTAETEKLLNIERFKRMKKGVYIINTARGKIIDTDALLWALENGIVKAAALDVFDPEPIPPDHPILKMKNVILTPHIAFAASKTCRMMDEYAIEEALRILRGEKPLWILNPEVLERDNLRAKIKIDGE
jgi:phosphoglycerate dehydrogenase-like enzyme